MSPFLTVIQTPNKALHPDIVGSSVFGTNGVYEKLKRFKVHIKTRLPAPLKLYFAKFDIKDAFNTINQDLLLKVVNRLLTLVRSSQLEPFFQKKSNQETWALQDEYVIQHFAICYLNAGSHKAKQCATAMDKAEYGAFQEFARKEATILRNVVMSQKVPTPLPSCPF